MAVVPAMENVALWHERDISHSSVERGIGPDATVTLDFALNRLTGVMDKLTVYPENMQANLDQLGGLIFSQRVLLALTQAGVSRGMSRTEVAQFLLRGRAGRPRPAVVSAPTGITDQLSGNRTMGQSDSGKQQLYVIVYFRGSAYG